MGAFQAGNAHRNGISFKIIFLTASKQRQKENSNVESL